MRVCALCESDITTKRRDALYCSRKCKTKASDQRRIADGRSVHRDRMRYTREADHRREYAKAYWEVNHTRQLELAQSRRGKRRAQKYDVPHEPYSRAGVFTRDLGRCHICQTEVDPNEWHLDHIVPLSAPGSPGDIESNVAVSHPVCNLEKGSSVVFGGEPQFQP